MTPSDKQLVEHGFRSAFDLDSLAGFGGYASTMRDLATRLQSLSGMEEALRECADKLWVLRCNSDDQKDREAAERACEMADAALASIRPSPAGDPEPNEATGAVKRQRGSVLADHVPEASAEPSPAGELGEDPQLQEIADGAWGDGPMRRGLARDSIRPSPAGELGQAPEIAAVFERLNSRLSPSGLDEEGYALRLVRSADIDALVLASQPIVEQALVEAANLTKAQKFLLTELKRRGRGKFERRYTGPLRRLEEAGLATLSIGTGYWSITTNGRAALSSRGVGQDRKEDE